MKEKQTYQVEYMIPYIDFSVHSPTQTWSTKKEKRTILAESFEEVMAILTTTFSEMEEMDEGNSCINKYPYPEIISITKSFKVYD